MSTIEPTAQPDTSGIGGRRLPVGRQIRRWRTERGFTLAGVAARSGLNVGYLSQIENDKASPSLGCLASIGAALDVPPAWFLMDDIPGPTIVRAADRPITTTESGRTEHVDGNASRDISILEVVAVPGSRVGLHAHPGDEHHLVLRGHLRARQGPHEVVLGPGDYLRWDGATPHEAEVVGEEEVSVLIMRIARHD
jgi:transcriptional regulator with XRE-family HTH domain